MSDAPGLTADDHSSTPSVAELLSASAGLVVAIGIPLLLMGLLSGLPLYTPWTKPFWLDEMHTALLVQADSFPEMLDKLGRGADFNPPGLYVLLRGWALLTGGPSEWSLRLFSSLTALAGLVGVYWMLRKASFPATVAFIVPLAVWSASPLLVEQAFEARFYAPWLAACVWLCNGLVWLERRPGSWPASAVTAVCSVLVCTIHYFGVITLGLIGLFHFAFHLRGRAGLLWPALLLALGPIALLGCWRLYQGQRAALGGMTWVDEATLATAAAFAREWYGWMLVTFFTGLFFVERMLSDPSAPASRKPDGHPRLLAGAFGLVFLPICLVLFSFLVQPALVNRYVLVFLVGLTPLFAVLLAPVRGWLLGVGTGLVVLAGFVTATQAYAINKESRALHLLARGSDRIPADVPLVVLNRKLAYQVWWYRPEDRKRVRVLFKQTPDVTRRFVQTEARVCERMAEIYPGLPTAIDEAEIARAGKVVLIDSRPLEALQALLPGHECHRIDQDGAFSAYLVETKR